MSKRILSAKDAAAITPSAASSIEVAALQRTIAWWGHLVMLAGWSLLGLWATRNGKAFGPREVLHDDVTTARCDHRSGPNDRSMR